LENCDININESKFIQAIINIFNNSNDVMKQKNIENEDRYVFVSCKDKKDYIELVILDSGGGIEDQYIAKVFEPYFSTKLDLNGTGIGLYITHQIITIHLGGKINVENFVYQNEGKKVQGAKFTIKLFK
jgi:signal transduction histidine kinase